MTSPDLERAWTMPEYSILLDMAHELSKLDDAALDRSDKRKDAYLAAGIKPQYALDPIFDQHARNSERHRRRLFNIVIPPKDQPAPDAETEIQMAELRDAIVAELERNEAKLKAAQRGHRATGPILRRLQAIRIHQLQEELAHHG
jgi:hypothetical protein